MHTLMSALSVDHDHDISIEAPLIGSYSGEQGGQSLAYSPSATTAAAHAHAQAVRSMSSRATEQPPNESPIGVIEEEEDDDGYTIDHLSAVVRPVALTMILSR